MTKLYAQLARRMVLTALIVSLAPLYILGAGLWFYLSEVQQDRQIEALQTLAQNRASAIGVFLAERTSMLEALVETASLHQLTDVRTLENLLTLLNRRSPSFLDLGVIDSQGLQLTYVGPYALEHRNYSDAAWFLETRALGVHVSDVFLGYRGVPHFVVAVKKGNMPEAWILRATIDSEVFNRLVRMAQIGPQGDAYIINHEGLFQTPPRFGGRILEQAALDPRRAPRSISVESRSTPDGRKVLTAFAWLPKEDWLLVIEESPATENLTRGVVLAVLGLGSLLIAGSIFILVRLMVHQLEHQDRKRAALDAQLAHSARLVSLGRMAAGVAHEINNPLAAIGELAGLMEDLMDETMAARPHGALFKENVVKIQQQVDRARSVTHRLLGFARRMEPRWDRVDVNHVLKEAYHFLEREATYRNVNVELELDQNLPLVKSDQAQLQQVFLNLIDNALDAVSAGGHVFLQTRLDADKVVVSVTDTGPGVPRAIQDKIFDPFYTTKVPGEGVGLGLSISHSIMQKLGGDLSLESDPGRGARFLVTLPLAAE
ncbi:MAG: ATP-binding protein [Thermodesulfobacteriota bacterium]